MSETPLPPPPRAGLGTTFKRPATSLTLPNNAGPNDPHVIISGKASDLPADLIAYYAGFTETVIAGIVNFSGVATYYEYQVWIKDAANLVYTAFGGRDQLGNVDEIFRTYNVTTQAVYVWGFHSPNVIVRMDNGTIFAIEQGSSLRLDPGCDFNIDFVSQARGLKAYISAVANSAAIGAEAVLLTTPAMTFVDGRAYAITFRGSVFTNTANTFHFIRIRKTNLAGALIHSLSQVDTPAVGAQITVYDRVLVRRNAGAGDLAGVALAMTGQHSAGTGTWTGSATDVRYLQVEDIGASADYPNAPFIT